MSYQLLTVPLLREIANRYGIPQTGLKADLIHRLQQFDLMSEQDGQPPVQVAQPPIHVAQPSAGDPNVQQPPQHFNTPATTWMLYNEDRLTSFITALGLDLPAGANKQTKADILAAISGLTPQGCQTAWEHDTRRSKPKIELQLTKQTAQERADAFVARARTHFQLITATDREATTLLINAALPSIAAFVTENVTAGVQSIDALLGLVQQRFAPNRFQFYEEFCRYRIPPNQSAKEAGNELRRLYLGYLQLTETEQELHAKIIGLALSAQFLAILPRHVSNILRTELLRQPETTWDQLQQLADQVLQGAHFSSKSTDTNSRQSNQQAFCSYHGYTGHSDQQCRRHQHRQRRSQSHSTASNQSTTGVTCFTCGEPGHITPNCPTSSQGQAKGN